MLCKSVSLRDRLVALSLTSFCELRVAAFLAGSDFNPPVVEAPWPEIAQAALALVASNPIWQEVVRDASAEPEHAEAFLANFDFGVFVSVDLRQLGENSATLPEAWLCGDSVAYGLTAIFPCGDIDPVLSSLVPRSDQDASNRIGTIRARCLAAYSRGALSNDVFNLVRHRSLRESIGLVDFAMLIPGSRGRPVAKAKLQMVSRLAQFLAGPIPDSWDDEEDHEPAFLEIDVEVLREEVLRWLIPHATWALQQEKNMKDAGSDDAVMHIKKGVEEARQAVATEMDGFGALTEQKKVQMQSIPSWVWDGARDDCPSGEETIPRCARMRSVFYLATGFDMTTKLTAQCQEGLTKALEEDATMQEQGLLLVLAIIHSVGDVLAQDHVQTLCNTLGVRGLDLSMLRSSDGSDAGLQYGSAVILGDMCWWMMGKLQDMFCLCGGERLIFANALPLRGGPVVLGSGIIHKAKDGYKISVKACEDDPSPEVVSHAQTLFGALGAEVTRQLRYGAFKVQGISAHDVFSYHGRIFIYKGVPYTMLVKPFD